LAKKVIGLYTRVIAKVTSHALKLLLRRRFGIDVQSFSRYEGYLMSYKAFSEWHFVAASFKLGLKHEPTRQRAAEIGERIREEDGVGKAVRSIEKIVVTSTRCEFGPPSRKGV
jgi:hypothetical protein